MVIKNATDDPITSLLALVRAGKIKGFEQNKSFAHNLVITRNLMFEANHLFT